jgi:hypothetical protein
LRLINIAMNTYTSIGGATPHNGGLKPFLSRFETGVPMIDYMIFAALASAATWAFNWFRENVDIRYNVRSLYYYFFKGQNIVSFEGKISTSIDRYTCRLCQNAVFSERFRALWDYIIKNVDTNHTIREIKEYVISEKSTSVAYSDNIYMVNQMSQFLISAKYDIYAVTYCITQSESSEKEKSISAANTKTDNIIVDLYSTKSSIQEIKAFVDDITRDYLMKITYLRENKKFIYSLSKLAYDDSTCEQWTETVFDSTRTFKNLFFDKSDAVISKVDFFLKNRDWYYDKGLPYTLGIGLHGPPGTGKTSFIKALANHTGRHIVSISLKLVKTKSQLESVFFESRYNTDNKKGTVGFDQKIIVFEDIDCIGDIVMDREKKKLAKAKQAEQAKQEVKTEENDTLMKTILLPDDLITLDDILELWDGIREASGRIMVISSNHYEDLDPALKRPGRIDITLELGYASREVVGRMYRHLVGEEPDPTDLAQIKDRFYTPAEIMNVYMNERRNMLKWLIEKV